MTWTTAFCGFALPSNNGKDLAALAMYFATAWLLAGEMDNGQELRDKLENGVRELGKAVLSSPDAVHGSMYDTILDLTAITTAVVAEREIKMESARQYPWKISIRRSWDSGAFRAESTGILHTMEKLYDTLRFAHF